MKSALKILTIIFCALCIILFMIYAGALVFFRHQAFKVMTPDQKAAYETFKNKKWTFDEDEIHPPPFQPETLKIAKAFLNNFITEHNYSNLYEIDHTYRKIIDQTFPARIPQVTTPTTTHTVDTLTVQARRHFKCIDLWLELTTQSDFHSEALLLAMDPVELYYLPDGDAPSLEFLADLIALKAGHLVQQGQSEKALDLIEKATSPLQYDRYTYSDITWDIMGFKEQLAGEWAYAVSHCNDIQRLKKTFQIQQSLYPSGNIPAKPPQTDIVSLIAPVRFLSRLDVKVDIQEYTSEEIAEMILTGKMEKIYREQGIEPRLTPTSMTLYQENIRHGMYAKGPEEKIFMTLWPLMSPAASPWLYAEFDYEYILWVYYEPENILQIQTIADLLRIHTATRIYTLQHGKAPENIEALIPQFFAEVPLDKFASSPQPYRQLNGKYYSVGLDNTDNQMQDFQSIYDYNFESGKDAFLISIFDLSPIDISISKKPEDDKTKTP